LGDETFKFESVGIAVFFNLFFKVGVSEQRERSLVFVHRLVERRHCVLRLDVVHLGAVQQVERIHCSVFIVSAVLGSFVEV